MTGTRVFVLLPIAFVVAASCSTVGEASGMSPPDLSISIDPSRHGSEVPDGFLGLSYEKSVLASRLFDTKDYGLIDLLRNLGPGDLRIGGNSVDRLAWNPSGNGLVRGEIAPADIARLAAFAAATGWNVIYGFNMAATTEQELASEAKSASSALGPRLLAFQIGNEPDLYRSNGHRPESYAYADFLKEWVIDAEIVRSASPGAPLAGPDAADHYEDYTVPFAGDAIPPVSLLTQHYYRANGKSPTSTVASLLEPDLKLPPLLRALSEAAADRHVEGGFRIAEANSFYNGGAPHVSDTFASALWAVGFLFDCAQAGASGVNFHGGGHGPGYTPIADDGSASVGPRPVYYGMLAFSKLVGATLVPVRIDSRVGRGGIHAWAATRPDHSVVVVISNSRTNAVSVALSIGSTATGADLLEISAPSLDTEGAVSVRREELSRTGALPSDRVNRFDSSGQQVRLEVEGPGLLVATIE